MGWFKKCAHHYHEVGKGRKRGLFNQFYDVVYVYCPKCDDRKELEPGEWERLSKEQEIKRVYKE